jgi:chromosome segregation ATPase
MRLLLAAAFTALLAIGTPGDLSGAERETGEQAAEVQKWTADLEEHLEALADLNNEQVAVSTRFEREQAGALEDARAAAKDIRRLQVELEALQEDGLGKQHRKVRAVQRRLELAETEASEAREHIVDLEAGMKVRIAELSEQIRRRQHAVEDLRAAIANARERRDRKSDKPHKPAKTRKTDRREKRHDQCRCDEVLERVARLEKMMRGMQAGRREAERRPRPGPSPEQFRELEVELDRTRGALEEIEAENRALREQLGDLHRRLRDARRDDRAHDDR